MNMTQILKLSQKFDGDIPKLIEVLNDPTLTQLAGLQHIEPQREAIVDELNFIKRVADVLLNLFPAQ